MSGPPPVTGEPLVVLDKRKIALVMYIQAGLFFAGGTVAAALGYLQGLFAIIPVPLLVFFGRSVGSNKLIVTDDGAYHIRGNKLMGSTSWDGVDGVKLVTERKSSGSSSSTSHTLVFSRGDEKPFKYLVGWRQRDRLATLARVCKDRGVPFSV